MRKKKSEKYVNEFINPWRIASFGHLQKLFHDYLHFNTEVL